MSQTLQAACGGLLRMDAYMSLPLVMLFVPIYTEESIQIT